LISYYIALRLDVDVLTIHANDDSCFPNRPKTPTGLASFLTSFAGFFGPRRSAK
jgi:hypothetical protein